MHDIWFFSLKWNNAATVQLLLFVLPAKRDVSYGSLNVKGICAGPDVFYWCVPWCNRICCTAHLFNLGILTILFTHPSDPSLILMQYNFFGGFLCRQSTASVAVEVAINSAMENLQVLCRQSKNDKMATRLVSFRPGGSEQILHLQYLSTRSHTLYLCACMCAHMTWLSFDHRAIYI